MKHQRVPTPAAMPTIGLSGVAAVLPEHSLDLETLAATGRISSSPEALAEMGFERVFVADESQPACGLAIRAAQGALQDAGLKPADIDLLVWTSALPGNHLRAGATDHPEP